MKSPAPTASKIWIAAVGLLGSFAVGTVSLILGLLAIGGVLITYGGWKSQIELRMTAEESTRKEQVAAVMTASKEMVVGLEASTTKRLDAIEHDRTEKLGEAARYRTDQSQITTELKTLVAGQQKQIDLLTEASVRRPPSR